MPRLVVVSNRVADPRKTAAGGLAVALADVLNNTGGLWFGWSGKIVEGRAAGERELRTQQAGPVKLVTIDLSREDHDAYYVGYSNGVLWPVFHYRLDLADFDAGYIAGYRRVNQLFARKLLPLLRDDDIIWVHDYHLIPLAAELRALGCRHRIGFFLHIPLPPPLILAAIPGHDWLIRALFAYDLVGFQSQADHSHFCSYVAGRGACAGPGRRPLARLQPHGAGRARFPIGIDVDEFTALTNAPDGARDVRADARRIFAPQAAGGRGPARLFEGPAAPHARLSRHAAALPGHAQQRHADPDRLAQPRGRQRLHRHPARAGEPVRLHQRQLRRTRLDAGALHAPHGGAHPPAGPVPRQPGGAGDAAARRHEPGGQGVHRRAGPAGSRRAGAVAIRRRRRAADAKRCWSIPTTSKARPTRSTWRCRCRSRNGAPAIRR